MKVVLMQFLSLDGVSQGPGSPEEDTSDGFTQGGWLVPHIDEAFIKHTAAWLHEADGLLLGRRTYDSFARDWPHITDPGDPFTELMNSLPKYVASHSLQQAGWAPTTILSGDVVAQVAELKRQPGRELQIHGSARLGQSLLAAGSIDELRLVIAPVVVGSGRRLFETGGPPAGLRLVSNDSTPGGLTIQVYDVVGLPSYGTYESSSDFV
jgi:dihydrofolate reductase